MSTLRIEIPSSAQEFRAREAGFEELTVQIRQARQAGAMLVIGDTLSKNPFISKLIFGDKDMRTAELRRCQIFFSAPGFPYHPGRNAPRSMTEAKTRHADAVADAFIAAGLSYDMAWQAEKDIVDAVDLLYDASFPMSRRDPLATCSREASVLASELGSPELGAMIAKAQIEAAAGARVKKQAFDAAIAAQNPEPAPPTPLPC